MLDVWADQYPAGKAQEFPVIIFNDLDKRWKCEVRFRLLKDGKTLFERTVSAEVSGFETTRISFNAVIPDQTADYQAMAMLINTPVGVVSSLRDFSVLTSEQKEIRRNLALGQRVKASSALTGKPELVVDGNRSSGWSSEKSNPQWLAVDLCKMQTISRIELSVNWGFQSKFCYVQVSTDGQNWNKVNTTEEGIGMFEIIRFGSIQAHWVRLYFNSPDNREGYSITEMAVFK